MTVWGTVRAKKAKMFVQMGRYLQKHVLEGANVAPANKATLTEFANPPSAHCPRARGNRTKLVEHVPPFSSQQGG